MEQTMETDKSRRPIMVAAVVATGMMLVFGVAYRVAAARLGAPVSATPFAPSALDPFPLQLGSWVGRDVPLDAAIIRETDTDAHINRVYSRGSGLESVSFYVAAGVRARDLMPHRPEVCYTGSGWTLGEHRTLELTLSDGSALPCKVFQFSRGTLSTQKVVVLYYYIVDGQYYADVASLRSRAWRGSAAIGYVGQVEIVTAITEAQGGDAARQLLFEFAVESARPTMGLFRSPKETLKTGG
jgi:hypothetical protein